VKAECPGRGAGGDAYAHGAGRGSRVCVCTDGAWRHTRRRREAMRHGPLVSNAALVFMRLTPTFFQAAAVRARSLKLVQYVPSDERGPGGLTRELETPLPSNSPHDRMILRGDLVGSRGSWKRPCLQTAHMTV
jgi:hypothetical protein